jgi:membrane protease subunit HflK
MPWQQQGGGPWGSGPSGTQPPDIEDLLRKGQERFRRMMPGGIGGGRGILIGILVLLAIWLASGLYRVQPAQEGVLLLFGKYVQTTPPGLHWFFPAPIGEVLTPNVAVVNRVEVGFRGAGEGTRVQAVRDIPQESMMLTGDQNIVDLDFTVFWKIKNAQAYLFNIRNPEATVKVVAESAMREVVGQTNLQQALTGGRAKIEDNTRDIIQKVLDYYKAGIQVTEVRLLSVDPPKQVIDAFNEVQRARQDKDRKQNEGEAYQNKVVPIARGDAARIVQEAQAYKTRVTKDAQGEAKRFLSVYDSYVKSKDITERRIYLQTMEDILQGTQKVIIDTGAKGSGVVPYLPLPALKTPAAPAPSSKAAAPAPTPAEGGRKQ